MSTATDAKVPTWVRAVMIAPLATPQLVIGVWALVAARNWYDTFPGVEPHLISGEPPFNQHLATDVGAGFFATGVALLIAGILARRSAVYVALAASAAFTVPHVLYHATHDAPALTTAQNELNVALLASSLLWLALAAWGARPRRTPTDLP
jgi:hypothetical protein